MRLSRMISSLRPRVRAAAESVGDIGQPVLVQAAGDRARWRPRGQRRGVGGSARPDDRPRISDAAEISPTTTPANGAAQSASAKLRPRRPEAAATGSRVKKTRQARDVAERDR